MLTAEHFIVYKLFQFSDVGAVENLNVLATKEIAIPSPLFHPFPHAFAFLPCMKPSCPCNNPQGLLPVYNM